MTGDLFRAKLYVPAPRADSVARPQLMARLDDGTAYPLTLICAPAGYGKTTLLSHWASHRQERIRWLSLDKQDNDPARFWTYVFTALLGQTTQRPSLVTLPDLINELEQIQGPVVLILDDYQFIQEQRIHEALAYFLEHLPSNAHVMIATRSDPPLPLARLRVRNQLLELRASDLRFSMGETEAFLNHTRGLNLSTEEVAALETRTEGWIASLQLAALSMSMKARSDLAGFVKAFTGSHVYVADYLVEEVLQHQPAAVQTFLLETSILERLTARLCEEVTGRSDGQTVLNALQRANLFLIPLDDQAMWFRYHHLFADLLQAHLQQLKSTEAIADLHRRAAAWYEQNRFAPEAVEHALIAGDTDRAARLIEQNAYPMLARGEMATVLQWFATLPDPVTEKHPMLCIVVAWVLTMAGAVERVEPLLQRAEAHATDANEVAGNAAAMRAFFAMLGGYDEQALMLVQRAEALLHDRSIPVRSLLPYIRGAGYRNLGQYENAAQAFGQQAQAGEESGDVLTWITGMCEVANTRHAQGRLRDAETICRLALKKLEDRGAQRFSSLAKVEVALCDVLREQGKLEEAHQRLSDIPKRMEGWTMPTDVLFATLILIRVQEAQGNFSGAFESLQAAKALRDAHPVLSFLAHAVDVCEIRLLLATNAVEDAARLLDRLPAAKSVSTRDNTAIITARVRLAEGRLDEAQAIVSALLEDAENSERNQILIDAFALQACILETLENHRVALAVLNKALRLAESDGFVEVFREKGDLMRRLLGTIKPTTDYIAMLLDTFPAQKPTQPEMLTPREFEVLRLIAAGDSNQTIAEKLVISVNAVKKHTGNIFGKLGVESRTQAVAHARELGLL